MKRDTSHPLGVPDLSAAERGFRSGSRAFLSSRAFLTGVAERMFQALIRRAGSPPVEFVLGKDRILHRPRRSVGRVTILDTSTLWRILRHPELAFGDAYSAGRLMITGSLVDVLFHLYSCMERAGPRGAKRSWLGMQPRPRANSLDGSQHNIHHHYNLGNDFYRLWLDDQMVYTCAYYRSDDYTLEQAQVAKMDHVCRKLRLEPGMRVVEAGCGWGSLALYMAREYGVTVQAFNISTAQIAYARERLTREGLEDRVQFVCDDYRNIPALVRSPVDAFVSVGMLEHVGVDNYGSLGEVIARVLKPEGLALLHSVGRAQPQAPNAWLEQRIFPGSYPPSLREIMGILEPHRFSVLDIENLRLHYARTLLEWLQRFDSRIGEIRERYDESFVRAWRLYLAGCAAAFRASSIQLYQVLFSHPDNNSISLTREHQYNTTTGGATWAEF